MLQRLRHAVGWPSSSAQTRLNFQVSASLDHGETLFLVGDTLTLGGYVDIPPDPFDQSPNGIGLVTTPQLFPIWYNAEVISVPSGTTVHYRYAVCSGGRFQRWEDILTLRTLQVEGTEMSIQDRLDSLNEEKDDSTMDTIRIVPRLSTGQAFVDPHVSTQQQRRGAKRSPLVLSSASIPEDEATCDDSSMKTETDLANSFDISLTSLSEEVASPLQSTTSTNTTTLTDVTSQIIAKRARTGSEENCFDVSIDSTDGVIIVAYRLPVTVTKGKDGTWHIDWDDDNLLCPTHSKRAQHPGSDRRDPLLGNPAGRVTDLMRVTWVGTVHSAVPIAKEEEESLAKALLRFQCIAVFLSEEIAIRYHKYSHGTLWPVFHNIVDVYGRLPTRWWNPHDQKLAWSTYTEVNRVFVDKVIEVYNEGDLVWVHGLHLLVLPSFLSRRLPFANVGLFLHTPFPSSEIFRTLSVRDELLRGMLSADHIGFHCYEYARHFLTCCRRILGLSFCPQPGGYVGVDYNGRMVAVTISHIGIQPLILADVIEKPVVMKQIEVINDRFARRDRILIVGIDEIARLKGLPLKLLAIEEFLKTHPEWVDKVRFIQIGIINKDAQVIQPDAVEKCRAETKELVDRINNLFPRSPGDGLLTYMEVVGTRLEDRMPWWSAADVLLVTSIRDGVNLYPFEFVYAQELAKKSGVVLLSEFSGSSRVLIGSIGINPWKREEIVSAIETALKMPEDERRARHQKDVEYIKNNTTTSWAERVLIDLKRARKSSTEGEYLGYGLGLGFRMLEFNAGFRQLELDQVVRSYRTSFRRVLLFDYSGTLVAEEQHKFSKYYTPSSEQQGKMSAVSKRDIVFPSADLLNALRLLCADPRNTVFVLSGKGKEELEEVLGSVRGLGMAAEHGYYYRWGDYFQTGATPRNSTVSSTASTSSTGDWLCTQDSYDDSWKDLTHAVMDVYTQRTLGTYIERKGSALIWQYRDADPEFGQLQVKELQDQLNQVLEYFSVDVIVGKGYLEVRPEGVDKGVMVDRIISTIESTKEHSVDFLVCIGDDSSDEFMFSYLEDNRSRPSLYTCTVGKKPSRAKFYVNDVDEVMELLNSLTKVSTASNRNLSMNDLSSYNFRHSLERTTIPAPQPHGGLIGKLKTTKMSMSMSALSSAAGLHPATSFTLEQYFSNIQEEEDEPGGIFF